MKKYLLFLFAAISIFAENKDVKQQEIETINIPSEISRYLTIDGYFRFQYFYRNNFDLDSFDIDDNGNLMGTSDIKPTLSETNTNKKADNSTISYNLRFRMSPQINVGEYFKAITTIDLFDNSVLNSTNDNNNDKMKLKEGYVNIKAPFGVVEIGRMGTHWGLGIFRNSGKGKFAVEGDYIDQMKLTAKIAEETMPDFNVSLFYQFNNSGLNSSYYDKNESFSTDLDDTDDEVTWGVTVGDIMENENLEQFIKKESRLNWGLYATYSSQDKQSYQDPVSGEKIYEKRNLSYYTLDGYLAFYLKNMFKVELEAIWQTGDDQSDSFSKFGGIVETEMAVLSQTLKFGVDFGFASGDNSIDPYDKYFDATKYGKQHKDNLTFNKDYIFDFILFRQITDFTNAYFVKPHVTYSINPSIDLDFATVYSRSLEKAQTFGKSNDLGLEFDLQIQYLTKDGLNFGVMTGLLFPGSGMDWLGVDRKSGGETEENKDFSAKTAYSLYGFMIMKF